MSKVGRLEEEEFQGRKVRDSVLDRFTTNVQ